MVAPASTDSMSATHCCDSTCEQHLVVLFVGRDTARAGGIVWEAVCRAGKGCMGRGTAA